MYVLYNDLSILTVPSTMEISISPNPDAFYYTSAPTSPRRYNLNGFFFLSMPTSPTRQPSRSPSGLISGSRTPETTEDLSPFADNFEFEGSKRFYHYDNRSEKSQDLSIAYADELFCDGKMLPLRPPPRARYMRPDKNRENGSTGSSPGGRSSMLRVPFLRQKSLWNDGFDPFMVALNKVKEDNEEDVTQLRRAKSLSPYRRPNGPARWASHKHKRLGLSPESWIEVNSQQKNRLSPIIPDAFGPVFKPREDPVRPGPPESRKQRIKKFLQKNASFGREVNGGNTEQKAPLLLRKLHSSGRFTTATVGNLATSNAILRVSREMKTMMKHRARNFICLVKGSCIKGTRKRS